MLRSKMTFITTPSCRCAAQIGTTLDTLITIATISLRLLGSWNSVGCLQAVICGEFTLGTAVKTWEEDTYEEGEICESQIINEPFGDAIRRFNTSCLHWYLMTAVSGILAQSSMFHL